MAVPDFNMNTKVVLFLAVVTVVATAAAGPSKRAATECDQYPFGWGYKNMGSLFTNVRDCLSSIQVTSTDCAYAAVSGLIQATEHEPYANSDRRKTVRFISSCLENASVDAARIDKAEQCVIDKLSPY